MNAKRLAAVLGVLIAVLLVLIGQTVTKPKANVAFNISPSDSTMTLMPGNKKISAGGTYLQPGTYSVQATRDHFRAVTQNFTVPATGAIKLTLLLDPSDTQGAEFYQTHPGEQTAREDLGGTKYFSNVETLTKNYPIVKMLPHKGAGYRIDYGSSPKTPDDPNSFGLYITLPTKGNEQRALNWIRYSGFEPNDYEIKFKYQDND